MANIDKTVLMNIYQASKIGLESSRYLYGKVLDRELKSQLNNYVKRYSSLLSQIEKNLQNVEYKKLDSINDKKQFMWKGINNINSYTNKEEISSLLMSGSKEGINSIIPYSNNDMVDDKVKKLANSYIMCEKENIQSVLRSMKKFNED